MPQPPLPASVGPARTVLVAGLLLSGLPLSAQQHFEVSAAGELRRFDSQLELATGVGIAGRLGYWIVGPLSVEGEASYARPRTDTPLRERVGVTTFGGWVLLNQHLGKAGTLFLKGGYAGVSFGKCPSVSIPGSGPCGSAGAIQGGVGGRYALSPVIHLRTDATVNRSLTDLKFSNVSIQAGIALMLGGKGRVRDSEPVKDPCSGAPNAARNDAACRDSDGDGIRDPLDQCAETPKGGAVDVKGCSIDSDHDGVPDGIDQCPSTAATIPVDATGCPAQRPVAAPPAEQAAPVQPVPVQPTPAPAKPAPGTQRTWVLPGSVWPYRAAVLSSDAFPTLDSIVAVLKAEPAARVEVSGYAYDRLIPADDTRLSQYRADAIRSYLTFKGIPVSRITAIGRGSQPLIDQGSTEESRTANRRVEIRIIPRPD